MEVSGNPIMVNTLLERFESKFFVAPDGCWLWLGAINNNGYGRFWFDDKTCKAHRISYELYVGSIPSGMQIDHVCRQTSCVNPHHLNIVTNTENQRRKPKVKICEHDVGWTQCKLGCARPYWRKDFKA
jgi:hypothetical protein